MPGLPLGRMIVAKAYWVSLYHSVSDAGKVAAYARFAVPVIKAGGGHVLAGNMPVVASGQGGLMVRIDPADRDALLARTKAEPMIMRGSPTAGWLRVASEHVGRRSQLQTWVDRGTAAARARPPK